MSTKSKIIISICIIITIIGLICGIRAIKNFYVIEKIHNSIQSNVEKDNYYLITDIKYNDTTSITKTFYKNGVGKMIAENGVYTWTDGKNAYMVDEENKTIYSLSFDNSIGLVSNEMFASLIPGYGKNLFERFCLSANLKNSIKTDTIDDKKCYKIKISEKNYTKTYWIEKNSNKTLKAKLEFNDGNYYEYDYKLQFGVTKTKDIELPDISEYTKIEAQAND